MGRVSAILECGLLYHSCPQRTLVHSCALLSTNSMLSFRKLSARISKFMGFAPFKPNWGMVSKLIYKMLCVYSLIYIKEGHFFFRISKLFSFYKFLIIHHILRIPFTQVFVNCFCFLKPERFKVFGTIKNVMSVVIPFRFTNCGLLLGNSWQENRIKLRPIWESNPGPHA